MQSRIIKIPVYNNNKKIKKFGELVWLAIRSIVRVIQTRIERFRNYSLVIPIFQKMITRCPTPDSTVTCVMTCRYRLPITCVVIIITIKDEKCSSVTRYWKLACRLAEGSNSSCLPLGTERHTLKPRRPVYKKRQRHFLCNVIEWGRQRVMAAVAVCGRFAVARQTDLRRQIGRLATCLYYHLLPTQGESGCPLHQPAKSQPVSVKPYQLIPTPPALPVFGTALELLASGGAPKIHEYSDKRHRQLGPIYREKLGTVEAVFVADSQLIQRVYQNEGKYPMHMVPEPWTLYNKKTGKQRGLFFMDGPLWNQRRRSLNKVFLRQKTVAEYADVFNSVVTDVLNRWRSIRDKKNVIQDLEKELYNWSVESLGTMIFGRRLGCVNNNHQQDGMHEFVHCVQQIFRESAKMTMIPPRLAYMLKLPVWRRFVQAADKALYLAKDYVEENVAEIVAKAGSGETVDGVLSQLLLQEDIKEDEIVRIIIDLFLAAADTTSHATQWALYLLAKNPHCQERIFNDIQRIVKPGETISEKHLPQLPYVKGVIKEALRLYPVAPFLTRVLSHDLVLGGYEIPAGKLILISLYTTGRDEKYFENPDKFMPERWIRQEQQDVVNTHACLPFGIGSRSCIGRRVAEMKMQFLIARAVQQFKLEPANKKEVGIHMRMITTPDEPITLRAEDRT